MERAVIVKGRVTDARHVELDEPVDDLTGAVEVTLRSLGRIVEPQAESIFDFIKRLPGGTRTKEEIDRQIQEERDSWERGWERER